MGPGWVGLRGPREAGSLAQLGVEQSLGHRLPRRPAYRVSCCGLAHTDHSTAVSSHVLATILLLIQPRVTVNEVQSQALPHRMCGRGWGAETQDGAALAVEGSGCLSRPQGQVTGHRPRPQGGRDSVLLLELIKVSAAAWG